ncbi:MAG: mandelate racemase/muconate lactonizing enzyme family protein [Bauldia sp.]|nr:mandelate racemase/muconate lactonizing enzyme family protein [Bauldia sp.]
MRIRAIRSAGLVGETPKGGWSEELRPDDSVHTLIAVHTDEGVTGYGSVFTNHKLVAAALDVLEPLYRNENALEPERVSEKLFQNSFWMGMGGSLTHAISGIDIALWDILGKATGQPVGRLLGGRYRERVRPYCSLLMDEPDAMRAEVERFRSRGFNAYKIGWGPFGRRNDAGLDEAIVAAARDAAGPEAALMVDAGGSDAYWPHGFKWALRTAEMLARHDVYWFEEPLNQEAIEDFVMLRRESPVDIATGETLTRRQSFRPWFVQGALDIVQPDVTKVGGISEQRRIAWMANEFGVRYIGHGWNTALGLAADLQLSTVFPTCDFVEFIGGSAYVDGITVTPFVVDDEGYLAIPDKPGLGVELDPDKVLRLAPDGAALFEG